MTIKIQNDQDRKALVYYFLTNLSTTSENYIRYYASRLSDPYFFHKFTYSGDFLNELSKNPSLLYFQIHSAVADILWELQGEGRVNPRNFYYLYGKNKLGITDKDLPLFIDLMLKRTHLQKIFQPEYDETWDTPNLIKELNNRSENYKNPLYIEGSLEAINEDDEYLGLDLMPDVSSELKKLDELIDKRFNISPKISRLVDFGLRENAWPDLCEGIIADLELDESESSKKN